VICMLSYNDLYETLRKEKYSDQLQQLTKSFILDVGEYFREKKEGFEMTGDMFSDSVLRAKKQFENSKAIFRELMLRRKKKILNLVFVAAETGIMKRDFSNMLDFEKELFEELVKAVEEGDGKMRDMMEGVSEKDEDINRMIVTNEEVEEIVDMNGNSVGPFKKGELVNLDSKVAEILVSSGKAKFIDV